MLQWWCAAQGVPWSWRWQPYPGVWVFCLGLIAIWGRMRSKWPGPEETGGRAASFIGGVVVLWIALDWPVGALGAGYLASVHMVQYLLIALVAPPLLLIGTPRGAFDALLGSPVGGFVRALTHPLVSMTTFVSIMGVTHWPWLVDTWMATQLGSFGLDILWLFSGIVFWWPVSAPAPAREWLTDGARIGYLIVATLVNTGVFAYLAFTELPLYATYELAPPVGSISSRDDQLVAGLLMKVGGAPIIWTAITILFFRAYAKSESLGTRERLSIPDGSSDGPDGSSTGAVHPGASTPAGASGRAGVVLLLLGLPLVAGCGAGTGDGDAAPWIPAGPLEVRDARIGDPPLTDRAGLYLDVRSADGSLRIVGVGSEAADTASLHRSEMSSGMMRMTPVDGIDVPADSVVSLRPGGLHVMLERLTVDPSPGETVDVVLLLSDGRTVRVTARVVALEDLDRGGG